jgi:hypothetical protein
MSTKFSGMAEYVMLKFTEFTESFSLIVVPKFVIEMSKYCSLKISKGLNSLV